MTFWTSHLYARCTKAISSATPGIFMRTITCLTLILWCLLLVSYAHFAARRAKYLLKAGASTEEIATISENWLKSNVIPSLYFA